MEVCRAINVCSNKECLLREPHETKLLCKDRTIMIKNCPEYYEPIGRPPCIAHIPESEKEKDFELISISNKVIEFNHNGKWRFALIIDKESLNRIIVALTLD